jgi:hypothetical protein
MYGKPPFYIHYINFRKTRRGNQETLATLGTRHRTMTNKQKTPQKTKKMSNTDPTTKNPGGKPVCLGRVCNTCVGKLENRGLKMIDIQSYLLFKTF